MEQLSQTQNKTENKEVLLPPFEVKIIFGSHGHEEHADALKQTIDESDVYIPECIGWNESHLAGYRDISMGRITPDQYIKEKQLEKHEMIGFIKRELELIYNTHKVIIILDSPFGSKETDRVMEHYRTTLKPSDNFRKILQQLKNNSKQEADVHNNREDYMVSQLYPKLKEVLAARPDLLNKKELKVGMFLGAVHTRVSHLLTKFGQKNTREFSNPLTVYSYESEAQRRFALGKEVSNELAAKMLLEQLVIHLLKEKILKITKNLSKFNQLTRKIVDLFSFEEIEEIFGLPLQPAIAALFNKLEENNIFIPENIHDLDKLLRVDGENT